MINNFKKSMQHFFIRLSGISCILGQLLPWSAQAKGIQLEVNQSPENTFETPLLYSKECSSLINLENKVDISEKEFRQGVLLHSLIEQISNSPLEYCDNVLMAESFDEIDGEDLPKSL